MKVVAVTILEFIISTLIVYLLYYVFMISKYDKYGKLKKRHKKNLINKTVDKIKRFSFKEEEKEKILTRGRKPRKKKELEDIKIPVEVEILIIKYNINISKINYKKLLKIVGLTCSIDISLIISVISLVPTDNLYISLLIGGLLVIPVLLISYSILGKYFKKKGLVVKNEKRNETNKRNRK